MARGAKEFTTSALSGWGLVLALGTAMVGSLFSSDSWNNVTFTAGEVKNPKRNLPLSLLFGVVLVSILYFLANAGYLLTLPLKGSPIGATAIERGIQFALNDRVGTAATEVVFGQSAAIIMALLIMISTFGCINGIILAGGRIYYAMARDGLFFKGAGELNSQGVPQNALTRQQIELRAINRVAPPRMLATATISVSPPPPAPGPPAPAPAPAAGMTARVDPCTG